MSDAFTSELKHWMSNATSSEKLAVALMLVSGCSICNELSSRVLDDIYTLKQIVTEAEKESILK